MRKSVLAVILGLALVVPSIASAHGDCTDDAACATGEICYEEACSAKCQTDAECPEEQVCANATACIHTGEHEDEGCSVSTSGPEHAFSLFGVALVAAAARLVRRRATRS